ncbi:hypothetical protein GQ42DRAFT_11592 [Ramicandelaber brevisporus]|nr:hypothetical protein GQ42DRAFT_11592 [Ramicandelaber brevisporus]
MSSAEAAVATPEPVEATPAPAPAPTAAAATEKTESEPAATTTATTSTAAAAETKSHFVQRLASLPLVADSLEYARATVTDESKPYAKYTVPLVGKAAQVLALAQEATAPYAEKLQGPLATADALASKGLDFVEKQFPVVTRPTGEVAAETKRAVDDAIAKVRSPIANAATAARELPSRVVSTADAYVDRSPTSLRVLVPRLPTQRHPTPTRLAPSSTLPPSPFRMWTPSSRT